MPYHVPGRSQHNGAIVACLRAEGRESGARLDIVVGRVQWETWRGGVGGVLTFEEFRVPDYDDAGEAFGDAASPFCAGPGGGGLEVGGYCADVGEVVAWILSADLIEMCEY